MSGAPAKRRWIPTLVKAIGVVLFLVVLARTDLTRLKSSLAGALSWPLAVAFAIYAPYAIIRSARWRSLLFLQGARYRLGESIRLYYAISFLGMMTPGRVGELARALYLKRDHGMDTGRAFAGAIVDRIHDVALFLVMSLALVGIPEARAFTFTALAVFGAGLAAACVPWIGRTAIAVLPMPGGVRGKLRELAEGYYGGLREFLTFAHIRAALLTSAGGVFFLVMCGLLQRAVGVDLPITAMCGVAALGALAAAVPVSVLGIGTRDALVAALYTALGVPEATAHAVAFSALYLVLFSGTSALIGLVAHHQDPVPVVASTSA